MKAKSKTPAATKSFAKKTPVKKPKSAARALVTGKGKLYTLEVHLLGGMVTGDFVDANPVVKRTIQILGNQTLEELHEAIFKAFRRFDAHMYEFIKSKRPYDNKAERYVLPMALEDSPFGGETATGTVDDTTVDQLNLGVGKTIGYLFDFGDDWWHQIKVKAIDDTYPPGKYPKLIKSVGANPPQYPGMEEEE